MKIYDDVCSACDHQNVCKYKKEFENLAQDIKFKLLEKVSTPLDIFEIKIKCTKFRDICSYTTITTTPFYHTPLTTPIDVQKINIGDPLPEFDPYKITC